MSNAIISTFKEAPKTKTGKWALGLSLFSILSGPFLGIMAAVVVPFVEDQSWGESAGQVVGFSGMIVVAVALVATLVLSIKAFMSGERSWAVWLALIFSGLSVSFWIFMLIGELVMPH